MGPMGFARFRPGVMGSQRRYLEDHTGFADLGIEDFEERRKFYESPDFNWYKQRPETQPRMAMDGHGHGPWAMGHGWQWGIA